MRLHHLGFVVRDLAAAAAAFEREGTRAVTAPIEDPVQRVVVQFFRAHDGAELWELVTPLGRLEDSPLRSRIARGGGLDHVCYELEAADGALEEALAREVEAGARVVCEPVLAAAFARRIAFVFRPSGRLVEFVEARPAGAAL